MRTIALEEHFATPGFMDGPGRKLKERAEKSGGQLTKLVAELLDVGDGRVAAMDAAGVDVQALSLTSPGVEQLEGEEAKAVARETNAVLAEAIRAPSDAILRPRVAADRRSGGRGGGNGACGRRSGVRGRRHQRPSSRALSRRPVLWPVLARAEALKLPIYLHPTQSPQPVIDAWYGGLAPMVGEMMAGAGWGWHIETALQCQNDPRRGVRRASRPADRRWPHGQVAAVHVPASRRMAPAMTKLKKPISAYLGENVHYTFSGFNFLPSSSNSCLRSASIASCFRRIILISRWRRAALFSTGCQSAPRTGKE